MWKGDHTSAVHELVRIAKYNRIKVPAEMVEEACASKMMQLPEGTMDEPETSSGAGYSDIFRRPRVFLYLVAVLILWYVLVTWQ